MNPTPLLLLILALLWAPAAWGQEDCDFHLGYTFWQNSANQGEGVDTGTCTPGTEDIFNVVDGASVLIGGNTSSDNGAGWVVRDGGWLGVDVRWADNPVYFSGTTGQSEPASGTFLYCESGGEIDIGGGYRQWGVASPVLQGERSLTNNTVWTIPDVGVCGGGAGEVGDACDDSSAGEHDHAVWFVWTDAKHNPADGGVGDTWVDESVDEIYVTSSVRDLWCTWDLDPNDDYVPGEDGTCYEISGTSKSDPYHIELEMEQTGMYGQANSGWTKATREIQAITLYAAAKKGDTCIELADDVIASDNLYNGRFIMVESTSLWDRPLKILKTRADEDCDGGDTSGGDGQDAVYFSAENPIPEDIPVEAAGENEAVIGYDFRTGDHGFVMSAIHFRDDSASGADYKFYFACDVSLKAAYFNAPGNIEFVGANIHRFEDVLFRDCGYNEATGPCLHLYNISDNVVMLKHVRMTGSSNNSVYNVILENVTGEIRLQDDHFRGYNYPAVNVSGSAGTSGHMSGRRITCQTASTATGGTGFGTGCIHDRGKALTGSPVLTDVTLDDAVRGVSGDGAGLWVATDAARGDVVRLMAWSNQGISTYGNWQVQDYVSRYLNSDADAGYALPNDMRRWDMRDTTYSALTGKLNTSGSLLPHGRIHGLMHHGQKLFHGGTGETFWNLIVDDADTDATCTGDECDIFSYDFDDDTTTVDVLERITVTGTGAFTNIINDESGMDSDADGTRIGGILVSGYTATATDRNAYGITFNLAAKVNYLDTSAGDFCFFNNAADGTGTWYDVNGAALSAYSGMYWTGWPTMFVHPDADDYRLAFDSETARRRCGAFTDNIAPGVYGRATGRMWSRLGIGPDYRRILVRDREGF